MENILLFNKFIDSLNSMNLNDSDLYEQYSIMKNSAKVLAERIDEISDMILEEMNRIGVDKQKFEYGTFTRATRTKYIYSDAVKSKEQEVKELKKEEESSGVAKVEETQYLSFR